MRFKMEFTLEKQELPVEYRRVLLSWIKKSLTEANSGKYFEMFFNGTSPKDYTFAVQLPKAEFKEDTVILGGEKISITFSTYDKVTGYILFAAFSEQSKSKFPLPNNNFMRLSNIMMISEHEVSSNQVLVKTMAPLAIRKHDRENNKDCYYVFSDDDFEKECAIVIKEQLLKAGFKESQISDFRLMPINMKKVVIKHYNTSIASSLGYIMLEGNKSVLNYLYKSGIGSRRSAGFGAIDIITE